MEHISTVQMGHPNGLLEDHQEFFLDGILNEWSVHGTLQEKNRSVLSFCPMAWRQKTGHGLQPLEMTFSDVDIPVRRETTARSAARLRDDSSTTSTPGFESNLMLKHWLVV